MPLFFEERRGEDPAALQNWSYSWYRIDQEPVAEFGLENGPILIEMRSPALNNTVSLVSLQEVAVPEIEHVKAVSTEFLRNVKV